MWRQRGLSGQVTPPGVPAGRRRPRAGAGPSLPCGEVSRGRAGRALLVAGGLGEVVVMAVLPEHEIGKRPKRGADEHDDQRPHRLGQIASRPRPDQVNQAADDQPSQKHKQGYQREQDLSRRHVGSQRDGWCSESEHAPPSRRNRSPVHDHAGPPSGQGQKAAARGTFASGPQHPQLRAGLLLRYGPVGRRAVPPCRITKAGFI
jgi:hypothetical protein